MIFRKFGDRSIQAKLAIVVMIICSSLVLLMTFLFVIDKIFSFRDSMIENHTMLAETITRSSIAPLLFEDEVSANETLSALSGIRDVVQATIYADKEKPFANYQKETIKGREIAEELKELALLSLNTNEITPRHRFTKRYLDLVAPITFENRQIGFLILRADLQHLYNRLLASIAVVITIIVALGIIAQFTSVQVHKSIAKPLIYLLNTMEAVRKEKNYSHRVAKLNDDEFGALSQGFNSMLAEIEARDEELAEYRLHLESEVNSRTRELVVANEKLQAEVEERKVIQDQLARAQRMEAIGTLAGGVAHDLNNILSGVVSYPDLLLIGLPKDHEMYAPLKTIQRSGNKAATIVQDLLTLARRGGMSKEIIELDIVVEEYLTSAECEKMLSMHPHVQITKNISDSLDKIEGSAVHLSKTVMNLVTNAAESMIEPGKVTISLKNCYLDQPIKGYDKVEKGHYVLLQITDAGHGISEEDINFIFEPFYTRKKMGVSGTGLGMAVVWGTVEDHKGYIDVKSAPEKGTTFLLYFPVTGKDIAPRQEEDIDQYRGSGETILVVDDVLEQRVIASAILKELGYIVETVNSGEEAIRMIHHKQFDLIVLDMMMDPGINGIETFMKILEIHPKQRGLIASGYSEVNKLEMAKEIGLIGYIRKPYTIREFGKIVREELNRLMDI